MNRLVHATLTVLAAVALLAACSTDTESPDAAEPVEIGDLGLTLELPRAWVELDPAAARKALEDDHAMEELVNRLGVDSKDDELVKRFITTTAIQPTGQVPVFAASAMESTNGVLPQIAVKVAPVDGLPSDTELEKLYRDVPLGIDYLTLTEVDTAVGPATAVAFKTKARSPDLHWARLIVDTRPTVIDISIVSGSRSKSEQLASTIAESLTQSR